MAKRIFILTIICAVAFIGGLAFAKQEPVIYCAMDGEFGNEGIEVDVYRTNNDPYWIRHTEIDPGGGLEYLRVLTWQYSDGKDVEFSGGPTRLILRLSAPRVEGYGEEGLVQAELYTVDSSGHNIRLKSDDPEEPRYLCRVSPKLKFDMSN